MARIGSENREEDDGDEQGDGDEEEATCLGIPNVRFVLHDPILTGALGSRPGALVDGVARDPRAEQWMTPVDVMNIVKNW